MRIYKDRFLRALANRAKCPYYVVDEKICDYLLNMGAICDEYSKGQNIKKNIAENTPFTLVCGVFQEIGINKPTCEDFANLMQCTIMGDSIYPECGGDCDVIDGEYKSSQFDRDTEPEITTKWELYECCDCGCKFYK